MDTKNLEIRVFPIEEPKGSTMAYASVAVDNVAAIRGIRVIDGKKGMFVTMPQSQDRNGEFHDLAYPLSKELRDIINEGVLQEYDRQKQVPSDQRRYAGQDIPETGRSIDVKLSAKVFPVKEPQNDVLAYASIGLDNALVIRGIKIIKKDDGHSVVMPQSKDKDGNNRDLAFPLSQDLRSKITKTILGEFNEMAAQFKQSIESKLAEGKEMVAQAVQAPRPQPSVAKSSPGLGA